MTNIGKGRGIVTTENKITATTTGCTQEKEKETKKRGRKRIAEDPSSAEQKEALDADAKRKIQNRAAQRAFRERKERRVFDLEEKVNLQEAELARCREIINLLREENEALRRGENPPVTTVTFRAEEIGNSASPPDVKPSRLEEGTTRPANAASPSFHNILNDPTEDPASTASTTPFERAPSIDHQPGRRSGTTSPANATAIQPLPLERKVTPNLDDLDLLKLDPSFDFDAPFDFSESMALPPLFASLLDDLSLPPSVNTDSSAPSSLNGSSRIAIIGDQPMASFSSEISIAGNGERSAAIGDTSSVSERTIGHENEDDEDDPPPLPLGRIPCDKPECDFTAVSCALPIPWRPPNAPSGSEDRDLWIAQKCWAKLVSHPLFDRCDPDELCQELRDKTRCSDDGRLVCHKDDVCAIFRSIPQKAKLRQFLQG